MDPRVDKLAKVLLHYSLDLKKGKILKIQGELVALPLIKAAYAEAVRLGAHPYVRIIVPDNEEAFLKHASENQLKFISPLARLEVNRIDALLHIWATENSRYLSSVDPKRQARMLKYQTPLKRRFFQRLAKKQRYAAKGEGERVAIPTAKLHAAGRVEAHGENGGPRAAGKEGESRFGDTRRSIRAVGIQIGTFALFRFSY